MKERFEKLLTQAANGDIKGLMFFLTDQEFFTAPCSTKYHLCKEGGLVEHTLNVMSLANLLASDLDCTNEQKRDIQLAALLHDIGKCGDYGKPAYVDNVLKNGKKSDTQPYKSNSDLLYVDHAIRSVAIAERYLNLSEECEQAILYHNGKYTHIGYDLKETPVQMVVHFADLWASRVIEVEE